MITGDQLDTAVAIGKDLGIIESADDAILGAALDDMSDEELLNKVGTYSVYARVQPEHKVRIVKAWRARNMVTAMTGDGVNDAPAIKSADIGVGMGITGTDVTKNVADMILADDNFATIVAAVEEGRRIYANIRKSIQFLLATNISEVISILVATILNFTILKPAHLLWINLITDSLPALALGMEEGEGDAMKQKPRSAREGVFAGGMDVDILYQGAVTSILVLIAYFVGEFLETGQWHITASNDGITMAFLTMSMCEIFHSFNMRSRRGSIFTLSRQNFWLWGSAIAALILTSVVIEVPALAKIFEFTTIDMKEYGIAMGLAVLIIPIVEIVKVIQRAVDKSHREKEEAAEKRAKKRD
jgi:Ca2+-transporting ATPase